MQIFRDKNEIDFAEFSTDFAAEAEVLKSYLDRSWKFQIEGSVLKLLHGEYKPIFINIQNIITDHQIYFYKNSYYQENLAKALGIKKGKPRGTFCDATGGMLGDSLMMSCFDIKHLDVYERHPLAAVLSINALKQFSVPISFHHQSAKDITKTYDVIYFDPMYEDKNYKSAPKKEMQVFRDLIGGDSDAIEVAEHLLKLAKERLVIKRPIKSAPLLAEFSHQIKGKSTRYDVYMIV